MALGLPVYNGEAFLAVALESVLGQTYGDFELVISDNASTDATQTICRDYASRDNRIRYVRQETNLGAVPNFNRTFALTDSHYFKWMAYDDICAPTFLEKAVAVLDSNPDVAWCHARSSHIDPAGRLLDDPESLDVSYADREAASASARFAAVLLGTRGCLDTYGLMRSAVVRRTQLYLPLYGAEKMFMAEMALLGRYKEIPETLFFARVTAQGSGNLATADEQQAFIGGRDSRAPRFARMRFLQIYRDAIARSAPDAAEAWKCRLILMRWVFQVSKWQSVIAKAVRGQGVGGGNVERVKRLAESNTHGSSRDMALGATAEGVNGRRSS